MTILDDPNSKWRYRFDLLQNQRADDKIGYPWQTIFCLTKGNQHLTVAWGTETCYLQVWKDDRPLVEFHLSLKEAEYLERILKHQQELITDWCTDEEDWCEEGWDQ